MQEQGLVGNILKMEHNSAGYLHALVEALRFTLLRHLYELGTDSRVKGSRLQVNLCRFTFWMSLNSVTADSQYYVTDPDFQSIPLKELLDKVR